MNLGCHPPSEERFLYPPFKEIYESYCVSQLWFTRRSEIRTRSTSHRSNHVATTGDLSQSPTV